MVIVSFLGILELMKVGQLKIVQENIFDDIWITYEDEAEHGLMEVFGDNPEEME